MYLVKEPVFKATPTVHEFTLQRTNEPWKFMSRTDVYGLGNIKKYIKF
jgi:hypothetical protein